MAQRQADLNGTTDLELLVARVEQDADGRHRPQLDVPKP